MTKELLQLTLFFLATTHFQLERSWNEEQEAVSTLGFNCSTVILHDPDAVYYSLSELEYFDIVRSPHSYTIRNEYYQWDLF
jgi:hypothetical protein